MTTYSLIQHWLAVRCIECQHNVFVKGAAGFACDVCGGAPAPNAPATKRKSAPVPDAAQECTA